MNYAYYIQQAEAAYYKKEYEIALSFYKFAIKKECKYIPGQPSKKLVKEIILKLKRL